MQRLVLSLLLLGACTIEARDPFYLQEVDSSPIVKNTTINGVAKHKDSLCCLVSDQDNDEEPICFLKEGDAFHGHKVSKISINSLVLEKEEEQVELTFD